MKYSQLNFIKSYPLIRYSQVIYVSEVVCVYFKWYLCLLCCFCDFLLASVLDIVSLCLVLQSELKELQDVGNRRLEKLRQQHKDTYNAIQWLRANKHLFKGDIYEPMMLIVSHEYRIVIHMLYKYTSCIICCLINCNFRALLNLQKLNVSENCIPIFVCNFYLFYNLMYA